MNKTCKAGTNSMSDLIVIGYPDEQNGDHADWHVHVKIQR